LAGRQGCTECHAADRAKPFPADHAGRHNVTCRTCHQPAE
jgi:hypothetical protein